MNNETMTVEEKTEAAHIQSAYEETKLNGRAINWRSWVEQMPTISAEQASCLMSALDPDKFTTMSERPGKNDPSQNIEKARIIQRLAKAQGKLEASPMEWVDWAKTQRINVHTGFLLAVWELPADTGSEGDAVEVGAGGTVDVDKNSTVGIPGKLPRTGVGKLAIEAAWLLENKTKRAATDKAVMEQLQAWADDGSKPDVLMKSNKKNRSVEWRTADGTSKDYGMDACRKTLDAWLKSRA